MQRFLVTYDQVASRFQTPNTEDKPDDSLTRSADNARQSPSLDEPTKKVPVKLNAAG
ncbi:hypothetical protein [Paracoccus beibuensis]|uniref:hypothetical protein n=1 Tax=Paracoccus beibuensis TaxID=547602 RepID=UPI0022400621|nr:hypothetical protein [Paracoccus beibuensis]